MEIEDLGKRLHLLGLLGLLSMNFIQSSAVFAVLGWLSMLVLTSVNSLSLNSSTKERHKTLLLAVYDLLLMGWFVSLNFLYVYGVYA